MSNRPIECRIIVRGRVARHWSLWLGELRLAYRADGEGGEVTELCGTLPDQAALHGLLNRIWNLNLTVLSVRTVPAEPSGEGPPAGTGR